jgi:hypothetical protein
MGCKAKGAYIPIWLIGFPDSWVRKLWIKVFKAFNGKSRSHAL